jgi:hypothetical protein
MFSARSGYNRLPPKEGHHDFAPLVPESHRRRLSADR